VNPRNDILSWVSLQHAAFFLRHELDARLRESVGVSFMERDLLGHMARCGDDWKMKDFAVALCVSKTAVTKLVNRLEAGGLVERVPSSVDRRVTQLRLTNRGGQVLRESRPVVGSFVKTQFADVLSPDELDTLGEALIKVLKLHDRWEGQERYLAGGAGQASIP
jgi:DNA-binding MarR family transcriptional regulator